MWSRTRTMPKDRTKVPRSDKGKRPTNGRNQTHKSNVIHNEKSFDAIRTGIEARLESIDEVKAKKNKKRQKQDGKHEPHSGQSSTTRGTKRNHQGEILRASDGDGRSDGNEFEPDMTAEALESEVRALGGSAEDLALIAEAESESEYEETATDTTNGISQDWKNGMNNILKEIAIVQGNDEVAEDTDSGSEPSLDDPGDSSENQRPQGRSKPALICEPRSDWFALYPTQPFDGNDQTTVPAQKAVDELHSFAKSLLQKDNDLYRQTVQSSSSHSFYNTVVTSGTLSDKISALTLAVQESPLHNMKSLESLVGLAKKRSRSQAVDVLRALKDLFAQGLLLPSDRKLYAFANQPALHKALRKHKMWNTGEKLPKGIEERDLVLWAFENWLKEQYFEIVKTLEGWCNDEIEFAKSKAIGYVYELLKERPEQEYNLLRLLVNKLGDPSKKVASQASYLVMQLLATHPAMKGIVVSAIETDFIFRPGQSLHGRYYAIITLNQTVLSSNEEELAEKLLGIYFSLFSSLLKTAENEKQISSESTTPVHHKRRQKHKVAESGEAQTDEMREKLTSALLTGVNRAYPYLSSDHKRFEENIETLFKIAHSANFNTTIQAMLLIQQLTASHQPSQDRFFRVLYDSLLDPRLITASKHQLYLNLLHRALKSDVNTKRVKAFVKRILQILSLHEPSFICGAFFLLQDLSKTFPGLVSLMDQAEDTGADMENFQDVDTESEEEVSAQNEKPRIDTLQPGLRYDGHKRVPEFAGAEYSCGWEVLPFLAHYHPSVDVSAEHYIRNEKLPGKPDLTLHTIIHFLDRFVYRNAKLSDGKLRGSSIMQPMASDNSRAVLIQPSSTNGNGLPINNEAFKAKGAEDVAAEDIFFHRYFNLGKDSAKKNKRKSKIATDIGGDEEDAVWQAMLESAPDLEGDEDDTDLSMSDLESEMDKQSSLDSDEGIGVEDQDVGVTDQDVGDLQGIGTDSEDGDVDIEPGIFDDDNEPGSDILEDDSDAEQTNSDLDMLMESDDSTDKAGGSAATKESAAKRRKKLKSLPIFASADDYAKMLEDDTDEGTR